MNRSEINVDRKKMDDIDKEDDSLALELYRNTMTGKWTKVVEMYKEHKIKAISAKINSSGDTALHVAVSIAPDEVVRDLVHVIEEWYNEEVGKIRDWYDKEVEKIKNWYYEELEKINETETRYDLYQKMFRYIDVCDEKMKKEMTDILLSAVWIKNNEGNTPLHVAASTGRLNICIRLVSLDSIQSLGVHNNLGESPLFVAAFQGRKVIFLLLHLFSLLGNSNIHSEIIDPAYRRKDGETILHCAIRWEYFDLAFEILDLEPRLAYSVNDKRITPLHLLASKPWAFRSGLHLGWWKKIIYYCIYIEELKHYTNLKELIDPVIEESNETSSVKGEYNLNFLKYFYKMLQIMVQLVIGRINVHCRGGNEDIESPGSHDWREAQETQVFERHNAHWFNIFHPLYRIFTWLMLSLGYDDVWKIKRRHEHSVHIMKILLKIAMDVQLDFSTGINRPQTMKQQETGGEGPPPPSSPDLTIDSNAATVSQTDLKEKKNEKGKFDFLLDCGFSRKKGPKLAKIETPSLILLPGKGKTLETANIETPILVGTANGITEMVEQILQQFPLAINEKSEGKNIVLLAVENRQPQVLQLLLKHEFVKHKLIHEVDINGNNTLHLAAKLGEQKVWQIRGAALQMQWEVKWYEFVKNNLPQHYCYQLNKEGKNPEEIFNETHMDLVREGGEWLKSTSNSCSVVATLIATVVFPAATTVPGGINDSGMPILVKHPAFTLFAISSLVALCFSIIALFLFLTILTSQYHQKDFRSHVPWKLLLALTLLFVSIGSMLISFCAGQFFLLKSKLKDMAFPVYTMICLPIILLSIAQFPLYFHLLKVTLKKVPPPSYKAVSL